MATPTEATDNPTDPRPGRSSLPTAPLFAVVGATDLAVQQVRAAAAGASSIQRRFQSDIEARLAGVEKRVGALDPKTLRSQAEQAPTRAVARALEVAGKAEAAYEELARRGKDLFDRVSAQPENQAFVSQAGNTLNRGKAAVTVARRAADDTASAIRGTMGLGRVEPVSTTEQAINTETQLDQATIEKAVKAGDGGDQAVPGTRTAGRKSTTPRKTTARKSPNATKGTTPRKTTATGPRAARSAAKKIGD